ncbi:MAG: imidazole glycerol phosphate synthase subunit HisH, partial [Anaerovoracaceae bacterium]
MIAIIEYGVGNLFSLTASLKYLGAEVKVTNRIEDIETADRIILPGVGAFEDAKKKLDATGLVEAITEQTENGKPLLGICLGMQLLFEESHEYGIHKGLGLVKGQVASIDDDLKKSELTGLKVPHIGWNSLSFK